jgi:hypothetical protein
MCFSPTASFVIAGVTGAAGIGAVVRADKREELALAAMPLFFAAQQAVEGLLWLTLPVSPEGPTSSLLTQMFLFLAKVFWPIFAPLAVLMIEPDLRRRRLIAGCLVAGAAIGIYFLWSLLANPHTASIGGGHIVYSSEPRLPLSFELMYLIATGIAPALSSHRAVNLFAAIVIVGSLVTYVFYWEAFTSVWCFFASAASAVVLFHFERARRLRLAAMSG